MSGYEEIIPVIVVDEVGVFFEEVGLLLYKDHLDKDFVWDAFSPYAQVYWKHAVWPMAKARRGKHSTLYSRYQELMQTMDTITNEKKVELGLDGADLREILIAERDQFAGQR